MLAGRHSDRAKRWSWKHRLKRRYRHIREALELCIALLLNKGNFAKKLFLSLFYELFNWHVNRVYSHWSLWRFNRTKEQEYVASGTGRVKPKLLKYEKEELTVLQTKLFHEEKKEEKIPTHELLFTHRILAKKNNKECNSFGVIPIIIINNKYSKHMVFVDLSMLEGKFMYVFSVQPGSLWTTL